MRFGNASKKVLLMNSVMVITMNKYLLIIAIIFIIISVVAGIYCKCLQSSVERIKAESSSAIERLQSECAAMKEQNNKLINDIERINNAYSVLSESCSKAKDDKNERENTINVIDNNWLMCDLPDGVQNMFK